MRHQTNKKVSPTQIGSVTKAIHHLPVRRHIRFAVAAGRQQLTSTMILDHSYRWSVMVTMMIMTIMTMIDETAESVSLLRAQQWSESRTVWSSAACPGAKSTRNLHRLAVEHESGTGGAEYRRWSLVESVPARVPLTVGRLLCRTVFDQSIVRPSHRREFAEYLIE